MFELVTLALLTLIAEPGQVPGVPPPPGAIYETELTKLAAEKAKTELDSQLQAVLKDPSATAEEKAQARTRAQSIRLKLAIYTTDKTLEETIAFYTQKVKGSSFLIAERSVVIDLAEVAQAGNFPVPPAVEKEWQGKNGRTARWTRTDQLLQISVEDYLIDPRDGRVSKKTVVLVTSIIP
jgi:hypothetical protein